MAASTTGKVTGVYEHGGLVSLIMAPVYCQFSRSLGEDMSPDEARLLGLKLIRAADKAEETE